MRTFRFPAVFGGFERGADRRLMQVNLRKHMVASSATFYDIFSQLLTRLRLISAVAFARPTFESWLRTFLDGCELWHCGASYWHCYCPDIQVCAFFFRGLIQRYFWNS